MGKNKNWKLALSHCNLGKKKINFLKQIFEKKIENVLSATM